MHKIHLKNSRNYCIGTAVYYAYLISYREWFTYTKDIDKICWENSKPIGRHFSSKCQVDMQLLVIFSDSKRTHAFHVILNALPTLAMLV